LVGLKAAGSMALFGEGKAKFTSQSQPETLAAAHEVGADVVYGIGGAQAIAAMAFGT
jgi:histidinol dehydrogenase